MPIIKPIEPPLAALEALETKTLDPLSNTTEFKAIRMLGVAEKKALSILKQYSIEIIKEKLELTAESTRNNPTGFFIKALEEDYKRKKMPESGVKRENKLPRIPNISDGTQLQNWAVANGLPAAPAGFDTHQYRQMLHNTVEKMRMVQEREICR
jgi:hypothetical protein